MKNINLRVIVLGVLTIGIVGWLYTKYTQKPEFKSKNDVVLVKKDDKKESIKIKYIDSQTANKVVKKQKNNFLKDLPANYKFTKIVPDSNSPNKYIKEIIIQQKQSQAVAKAKYQQQQLYKAQQQRAYQSRQNYQSMQRVLNQRDPNKIKSNQKMMQNKQVRSYIAKNSYIQRQKQLQERMKMQQKIVNQQNR